VEQADILIVEDDTSLIEVTGDFLTDNGFSVKKCCSGSKALETLKECSFRLIILDINLPDLIGFDVCSLIRKTSKVPIIFLSARISDTDKIKGLDLGVDDYISKPYSLNELLSRVKAQIRRTYDYNSDSNSSAAGQALQNEDSFTFGNTVVNFTRRTVFISGVEKDFPAKEFDLLAFLIRNRNKSISKETLFNAVWGYDSIGEISTLSVHIRRLREKIEEDPSNPTYIKTIWSVGFRFEV
jgi:DNA-binding response OmpR family regulator